MVGGGVRDLDRMTFGASCRARGNRAPCGIGRTVDDWPRAVRPFRRQAEAMVACATKADTARRPAARAAGILVAGSAMDVQIARRLPAFAGGPRPGAPPHPLARSSVAGAPRASAAELGRSVRGVMQLTMRSGIPLVESNDERGESVVSA